VITAAQQAHDERREVNMNRLRRRSVDPTQLADIARQFYLDERREKEIGGKLSPPITQPAVARLLQEARERRVVWFDIDDTFALIGDEDKWLSRELQDRFQLKGALVVDIPEGTPNNHLHFALANHAGLKAFHDISEGDHICVAGGRTIVHFARFVGRRNPKPRRHITISPLGGRIWTGSWQIGGPDELETPLDADDSAFFMYVSFQNQLGTRFSQISQPLFAKSAREAQYLIKAHCPALPGGRWNWKLKPATRAYVGVGVLNPQSGHRIAEFLTKTPIKNKHDMPYLSRIEKALRQAMARASTNGLPPLGDIANRLFAAVPVPAELPKDLPRLKRMYTELLRVITSINERAVVMGWRTLHVIPNVNVISGTLFKRDQLWSVLSLGLLHPNRTLCTELTTDSKTATALISAQKDLVRQGAEDKLAWYRDILPTLFPEAS
jgi:DNA-binding transcriptional regulator LsrR (DeoR family)